MIRTPAATAAPLHGRPLPGSAGDPAPAGRHTSLVGDRDDEPARWPADPVSPGTRVHIRGENEAGDWYSPSPAALAAPVALAAPPDPKAQGMEPGTAATGQHPWGDA